MSAFVVACGGGNGNGDTAGTLPPMSIALFAGNLGGPGNSDGLGADARFGSGGPYDVAIDDAGNIFVADIRNNTIRKIAPAGVVSTVAGSPGAMGSADGVGAEARFFLPMAVATDTAGNVYVADVGDVTIRVITPAGVVSTFAGSAFARGSADGSGTEARFYSPRSVAADSAGNVYVSDGEASWTIRKITPARLVSTLAGTAGKWGNVDGMGEEARFGWHGPNGIAADSMSNVYVADGDNRTIRKITPARVVSTLAGVAGNCGVVDGTNQDPHFAQPYDVATDSLGNVYVADEMNHTVRMVTVAGVVCTVAGRSGESGSVDGSRLEARFYHPKGVAVDRAGNIYVADSGSGDYPGPSSRQSNNTVRKISPAGVVSTVAGSPRATGSSDGKGAEARFYYPTGMATDRAGNVYVADHLNHTIRKISPDGVVSTLAGSAGVEGSADGTSPQARFRLPKGLATDRLSNLYVADSLNNTIRKITPTGTVSTLAGEAGHPGGSDGSGAEARFDNPRGVAADSAGNVYVADTANHTIRKISPAGVVSTLAGRAGEYGSADGTAAAARFNWPSDVAVDSIGNVYVADSWNNTVRKVTPEGVVNTLAGRPGTSGATDGTGTEASFDRPEHLTTDSVGNVYVADTGSHTVRKISPDGVVTTLVGASGRIGFTPGPLPGVIASPQGVTVHGTRLYVSLYNGVAVISNLR